MKILVYLLSILLLSSCMVGGNAGSKGPAPENIGANIVNPEEEQEEKKEYDLIIMDPGFESWFVTQAKPMWYYSNSYYKSWNQIYVQAWNERADNPLRYGGERDFPFENHINYDPNTDYGIDLNYKLFWYFKYVENKYGNRYNFPGTGRNM